MKDFKKNLKHLCPSRHTHNPGDDARGNAEAFLQMKDVLGLKIDPDSRPPEAAPPNPATRPDQVVDAFSEAGTQPIPLVLWIKAPLGQNGMLPLDAGIL